MILLYYSKRKVQKLPQFVALDLGKLPPISLNHIDATALVVQAENVMTKVDVIQTALQTQLCVSDTLSDAVDKLLKRMSDIEKRTDIHELNQFNDNKI